MSSQILYAGYQVPYCSVGTSTGVRGWLGIQILLWAITVVLIYRTGAILFDERTGFVAGLLLAILWETFRFVLRPQSDFMFIFVLSVVLFTLAKWISTSKQRWNVLAIVAMVYLSLTRPFGFPIFVGWVGWLIFRPGQTEGVDIRSKKVQLSLFAVGVIGVVVAVFFLKTQLNPAHTDPSVYWRKSFVAKWANGIVVTHPGTPTFEYNYTPREASGLIPWMLLNADHLISMMLLKAAFFFVPILPRWSTFHILMNMLTLFPVIIGTLVGGWLMIQRREYENAGLTLTPILMIVVTVSLTFLDGGFNYRAPATLAFVLVSAYAVSEMLEMSKSQEIWNIIRDIL